MAVVGGVVFVFAGEDPAIRRDAHRGGAVELRGLGEDAQDEVFGDGWETGAGDGELFGDGVFAGGDFGVGLGVGFFLVEEPLERAEEVLLESGVLPGGGVVAKVGVEEFAFFIVAAPGDGNVEGGFVGSAFHVDGDEFVDGARVVVFLLVDFFGEGDGVAEGLAGGEGFVLDFEGDGVGGIPRMAVVGGADEIVPSGVEAEGVGSAVDGEDGTPLLDPFVEGGEVGVGKGDFASGVEDDGLGGLETWDELVGVGKGFEIERMGSVGKGLESLLDERGTVSRVAIGDGVVVASLLCEKDDAGRGEGGGGETGEGEEGFRKYDRRSNHKLSPIDEMGIVV